MTPTQRTLKANRELGREPWIVERFIPGIPHGKRIDCYHFMDLLAISPQDGIVGIQSCGQGYSEHVKTILAEPRVKTWLHSGGKAELWGWRKLKRKRGGKAMIWMPRVADIILVAGEVQVIERKKDENKSF